MDSLSIEAPQPIETPTSKSVSFGEQLASRLAEGYINLVGVGGGAQGGYATFAFAKMGNVEATIATGLATAAWVIGVNRFGSAIGKHLRTPDQTNGPETSTT
ncbi:MAG: hypothetical protein UU05_C0014G0004 [Candidatus Curtissbacteria bacterium GW2011_GWA1_40_47]|nr:MAG: hypothetical protein UT99_C0011G0004 [Candidatus Curtissbacteria bacterium GW2011_GWA2_40_31]KKR61733.1 MAG: hypothetical protein UU00_C0008G0006 [Microgenomates group bacterium GW2011_GWC1_40_35]KKR65589.1 MAG: hypothetical protein UU05_C0014G0004 [Candidatus Curtissbacteria bacterium GW2011_GWA1_40_47]OGH20923.1 MAG: hypothetical protein A2695_01010 [Candidatus Levybacteria bacterium RIFCSPHIGHO2_01_FULL_40_83]